MTSYDTTYNRELARDQRLYDYANIKNDTLQYNMGPTHQGGGMSGGVMRGAEMADMCSPSGQFSVVAGRSKPTGSGVSGGKRPARLVKGSAEAKAYMASIRNKRGKGASGAGFFDDVLSGISKAGQVAGQVLPVAFQGLDLYNKVKGKGMSGGRNGNVYGMPELLGRTSQVMEGRGGTDGFPSGFKDNNPNAMSGGMINPFDKNGNLLPQFKKGIMSASGASGGRRGCGTSGGAVPLKQQLVGILDDRTHGNGMSGGDFWSDFGDGFMSVMKPVAQVVGAVAPFLGGGASGGNVPSELALMSGSTPFAEAFLGGRRPADVPKDEKVMLLKKAFADYAMMKQLKKHLHAAQGRGMSGGGKLTITHGAGMAGCGDDDGLANSSPDFPMGMGMSGGMSHDGDMAMADAMGDIFAGMGASGGRRTVGGKRHNLKLKEQMYGTSMTGNGNYGDRCCDDDVIGGGVSGGKRLVKGSKEAKAYMASIRNKKGRGMSGAGIMEPAVSAEVGQPRYSYGNMADTAGKSNVGSGGGASGGRRHRGNGMSGGDFLGDLGSVASSLAPLLAFL